MKVNPEILSQYQYIFSMKHHREIHNIACSIFNATLWRKQFENNEQLNVVYANLRSCQSGSHKTAARCLRYCPCGVKPHQSINQSIHPSIHPSTLWQTSPLLNIHAMRRLMVTDSQRPHKSLKQSWCSLVLEKQVLP